MLSKNEQFKPPTPSEEWSNSEFTNVLDYLCETRVRFNGTIFLEWLAAPYISIWFARSTESLDSKIWIMHNLEFSDYIISSTIKNPREALFEFAKKWGSEEIDTLRIRLNNMNELGNYTKIFLNVYHDDEIWIVKPDQVNLY
ncbi:MAG: DUF4826 family protein [Spirochaetaceae bacterium]